jgi:GTP-binding protein
VELQMLADVGLVGFPNAGKSSLLDKFTNARPKIAPYPFTTKIPNLGVLSFGGGTEDSRDIIIADIPGLIEGASEGMGLGIRFLKHISRTAVLAFLIDVGDDNYKEAFDILLKELNAFSQELTEKRRVIVATKMDVEDDAAEGGGVPARQRLEELKAKYADEQVVGISVFSGAGIAELAGILGTMVGEDVQR